MTRYALITAVTLAAALTGPALTLADEAGAPPGRHGFHQQFQQALGLSDDQMTAIRDVRARQRDAQRQIGRSLGQAQRDLRQLALSGADDAAVQAKIAEIAGLHGQALKLRVDALREIAPILTDEQRQKFAQLQLHRPWHHRRPPAVSERQPG